MFHANVSEQDVLQLGAVHRFQRETARMVEEDVPYGHGIQSAGAFGAELYAPGRAVAVGGDALLDGVDLVQYRSRVVAADGVVLNQDVGGGKVSSCPERALQDDRVIGERVHDRIPDRNVLRGVDVESVAIGVDDQPINRPPVHRGAKNGEVAAILQAKVAKDDVRGVLQADGFVCASRDARSRSHRDLTRLISGKDIDSHSSPVNGAAVDQPGSGDHDIADVDAVDQAVRPVGVAFVLDSNVEVLLRGVIESAVLVLARPRNGCLENGVRGRKVYADVALQPHRVGLKRSMRNDDGSSAGLCGRVNRSVDSRLVLKCLTAGHGSIGSDVEEGSLRARQRQYAASGGNLDWRMRSSSSRLRRGQGGAPIRQQSKARRGERYRKEWLAEHVCLMCLSVGCAAAAYVIALRRNKRAVGAGEKVDNGRDLLRLAGALHRNAVSHILHLLRGELVEDACLYDCRRDGVHAYALGRQFLAERFCKPDDAGLRG